MTLFRRHAVNASRRLLWVTGLAFAAGSWAAPPQAGLHPARPLAVPSVTPPAASRSRPVIKRAAPPHPAIASVSKIGGTLRVGGSFSQKGAAAIGGPLNVANRPANHGAAAIDGSAMRAKPPR